MQPFRFIHAADLHLDSLFIGLSGVTDQVRAHLRESTFAALENLVQLGVEEKVDFIVLSGDIYDAGQSSLRAQLRFQEAMQQLEHHGIPVYMIHGNHDPLDSPKANLRVPSNVHVFGPEVEKVIACHRGTGEPVAVVGGVSYRTSSITDNLALSFTRDSASNLFHIAILHANVDGNNEHDSYAPCTRNDLFRSGFDYWALGHIHKRQVLSVSPAIVYPGNIQGRHIKETGPKGCYVVDVNEESKCSLTFHELANVRWYEEELSIDGMQTEEDLKLNIEELLDVIREKSARKMSLVRIHITGRGILHHKLEAGYVLEDLLQEIRRREALHPVHQLVWIEKIKVATSAEVDHQLLIEEDSFLGELFRLGQKAERDEKLGEEIVDSALAPLAENRHIRQLLNKMSHEDKINLIKRAKEMAAALLHDHSDLG
ncbi:DNA repair exonuclease [Paenibacillus sediminis]|uniref:DNA repair exonuclease SbcCD nuclease subunit n=1 Tax=Paenibacillus sediminis TaxID=664909 RepID=A0ABS4H5A3_9BACL|nr:DNA repair exonuclease [Paenibacillus sediminis]MBP1937718.1 DNA repair exonuclease SbcCD nuclease subunit [Paenibacillus sediminis]